MSEPSDVQTLVRSLAGAVPADRAEAIARTLQPHLETFVRAPRGTVRPSGPVTADQKALADLGDGGRDPLIFEGELGRGGMGVVRLATQTAVGRKVAVKTLRPGLSGERARVALLQEAWATGAVEHPNIVPVYDLGLDSAGQPQVVLKRIAGVPWGDLLDDPEGVRARFSVEDALEWHVRTLMQVCTAIHFAHDRGVIHRDLKPENVMVGDYGEIYVLDWGIALAYRDGEGMERLPSTADVSGLAGTPCYMAPEMLEGDGALLGPHTDVYLLGGLLYHILEGSPPHRGATALEVLMGALAGPAAPPGPHELVQVCQMAMAPAAGDRYASAEAMRQALQRFLDHRHSAGLAAQARASLAHLRAGADSATERYRLYGECRFGFTRALDSWPGNVEAREGLTAAVGLMVEHALAAGQDVAAEALLAELASPPPELAARVVQARRAADAERERMARLSAQQAEMDSRKGRFERSLVFLVAGLGWVVPPVLRLVNGQSLSSYRRAILEPVIGTAVTLVALFVFRRAVGSNRINRRIAAMLVAGLLGQVTLNAGAALMGAPLAMKSLFGLNLAAFMVALFALTVELRLMVSALGFLTAYFVAAVWPGLRDLCVVGGTALLVLNIWWTWALKPRPAGVDAGLP